MQDGVADDRLGVGRGALANGVEELLSGDEAASLDKRVDRLVPCVRVHGPRTTSGVDWDLRLF